ncbi:MAG: hypothetical protein N2654_05290, partial [Deltaproteobacteria bacterium]|nr:hypothetical protein [Deltaproteobacteria bacterium]
MIKFKATLELGWKIWLFILLCLSQAKAQSPDNGLKGEFLEYSKFLEAALTALAKACYPNFTLKNFLDNKWGECYGSTLNLSTDILVVGQNGLSKVNVTCLDKYDSIADCSIGEFPVQAFGFRANESKTVSDVQSVVKSVQSQIADFVRKKANSDDEIKSAGSDVRSSLTLKKYESELLELLNRNFHSFVFSTTNEDMIKLKEAGSSQEYSIFLPSVFLSKSEKEYFLSTKFKGSLIGRLSNGRILVKRSETLHGQLISNSVDNYDFVGADYPFELYVKQLIPIIINKILLNQSSNQPPGFHDPASPASRGEAGFFRLSNQQRGGNDFEPQAGGDQISVEYPQSNEVVKMLGFEHDPNQRPANFEAMHASITSFLRKLGYQVIELDLSEPQPFPMFLTKRHANETSFYSETSFLASQLRTIRFTRNIIYAGHGGVFSTKPRGMGTL